MSVSRRRTCGERCPSPLVPASSSHHAGVRAQGRVPPFPCVPFGCGCRVPVGRCRETPLQGRIPPHSDRIPPRPSVGSVCLGNGPPLGRGPRGGASSPDGAKGKPPPRRPVSSLPSSSVLASRSRGGSTSGTADASRGVGPRRGELASGRRLPHRLHGRAVAPPPDLRRGAAPCPLCDLATARRRISPGLPQRQGRPGRDGHAGRGPRGDGGGERESGELERGEGGRPPDARPGAHVRLDSGGGRRLRPGRPLEGVGASGHGLPQAERGGPHRCDRHGGCPGGALRASVHWDALHGG